MRTSSRRIRVDRAVCESHGQCVFAAPELFDFDDDGELVHAEDVPESGRADAETAARACPVQAITIVG